MMRLKSKLLSLNADKTRPTRVFSPANCEELRIPFKADKIAKVVGKLAQIPPPLAFRPKLSEDSEEEGDGSAKKAKDDLPNGNNQIITGVLVQNDFKLSLMAPEDLREYAGLTTTTISCRQRITLSAAGVDLIRWALEGTFGGVAEIRPQAGNTEATTNGNSGIKQDADEEVPWDEVTFVIMDCVSVHIRAGGQIEVEWEGSALTDGIADAVFAVLLTVESSPASVKRKYRSTQDWVSSTNPLTHFAESSKFHNHSATENGDLKKPAHNPHATLSPEARLSRLCMYLEAQFGPAVTPLPHPRANPAPDASNGAEDGGVKAEFSLDEDEELARLHALGIPVPGVEIRVDGKVARVWLEDLDVECADRILRERVRVVVERGVECTAGLWAGS